MLMGSGVGVMVEQEPGGERGRQRRRDQRGRQRKLRREKQSDQARGQEQVLD